jgi:hypothetical protein
MCCPRIFALGLNVAADEVDPPPDEEPHALSASPAHTASARKTPEAIFFLLGTIRVLLFSPDCVLL